MKLHMTLYLISKVGSVWSDAKIKIIRRRKMKTWLKLGLQLYVRQYV
jgi:hypothetical protein